MIITIRNHVSSQERSQLSALLCRLATNQRPLVSTTIDECEVIVLDDSRLDVQACNAIRQQSAVERVVQLNTPYKLVSRASKAQSTAIQVGKREKGYPV